MKSLPTDCHVYKTTPVFTENTVPAGLLRAHQTKAGTWARIVVVEGQLLYRILEPVIEVHHLDVKHAGVVEPTILHEVDPIGQVRFYVEFNKRQV